MYNPSGYRSLQATGHLFAAHILCGEFREFLQVSPSRGGEGGEGEEGFGGVGGELVAVGFRDFLGEAVGAEQAEQASDPLAFLVLVQSRLVGQRAFAQVAVTEPVQRELAAADRLEQVGIGLGQRVQRAGGATVERGPLADFSVACPRVVVDSTGAGASR